MTYIRYGYLENMVTCVRRSRCVCRLCWREIWMDAVVCSYSTESEDPWFCRRWGWVSYVTL